MYILACCNALVYSRQHFPSPANYFPPFFFTGLYLDRLSCDSCSPMEVASSIIKDNLELALALTEDIFKQVMVLMEKMTYGYQGNTDSESDTPPSGDTSPYSSMSMEWSPFGSLKCLKFLYAAVWVNGKLYTCICGCGYYVFVGVAIINTYIYTIGETVVQNASVIIRLLIQYPDSLGPGTLGKNLGIVAIFQDSMSLLSGPRKRRLTHQETTVRFERDHATLDKKSSSTINLSSGTADIALSFYTFLVRLLAFCAPIKEAQSVLSITHNSPNSDNDHVIPFLQSLISFEDVKTVLSMPLSTHSCQGIRPKQKQAMLTFLDRVYSHHDAKFFLHLIKEIFLNDITCNTYLCKVHIGINYIHILLVKYIYTYIYVSCWAQAWLITCVHYIFRSSSQSMPWLISTVTCVTTCYRIWSVMQNKFIPTLWKRLP